jgi:hypothetical protein
MRPWIICSISTHCRSGSPFAGAPKSPAGFFHREGNPIHGLRAVLNAPGRGVRTYKGSPQNAPGRRIGAVYPHLPDAALSGFLIEVERLPRGRFEVRDREKIWRTIFSTRAAALPLEPNDGANARSASENNLSS